MGDTPSWCMNLQSVAWIHNLLYIIFNGKKIILDILDSFNLNGFESEVPKSFEAKHWYVP